MKTLEEYLNLKYRASVYQDEDGDFIVEVDDLPGCVTHGATAEEAFENVEEAKRVWMESRLAAGLEIPRPKKREQFSGRVLVRMPRSLHHALSNQARYEGVSLNQHIITILSAGYAIGQSTNVNVMMNANNAFAYGTLLGGHVIGPTVLCKQSYSPGIALGETDFRQSFSYSVRDSLESPLAPLADQQVSSRRGAA